VTVIAVKMHEHKQLHNVASGFLALTFVYRKADKRWLSSAVYHFGGNKI
jgi:hypothetical protein